MKYQEIINERVLKIDGIKVLMNPVPSVLINFVKQAKFQELRGLFDEEDFFFWDAEKLIHHAMAPKLGIIQYTKLEIRIFKDKLDIGVLDDNILELWDNLYFDSILKLGENSASS